MSTLNKIAEQTIFLLDKHKEARAYCGDLFDELKDKVEEKRVAVDAIDDAKIAQKVTKIADFIDVTQKEYYEVMDEDISFLEEQLKAIDSVLETGNPAKMDEFAQLLLDGTELSETDAFKKEVEEEAADSMASFSAMIEDLQHALAENNIDDVLNYLQQLADDSNDDADSPEDDTQEDSGCCGGLRDCGSACVCNDACGCPKEA